LGEPKVAVRPGGDAGRLTAGGGEGKLGVDGAGGDAPGDFIAAVLGEPEVAVRPGRDAERQAVGRGDYELRKTPCEDQARVQCCRPGPARPRNRTRSQAVVECGEPARGSHETAPGSLEEMPQPAAVRLLAGRYCGSTVSSMPRHQDFQP